MRFIDISGVGNSGKTAVTDLLREVEGVYSPEYSFEFDLFRVPGGLLDLRRNLKTDWSPVRSHAAYFQFLDVVTKMGANPAWWNIPGLFRSTSQRYQRRFNHKFQRLSEEFVNSFVKGRYRAEWPYENLRMSGWRRFLCKVLRRLGMRRYLMAEVVMIDGEDFDARALAYLSALYREVVQDGEKLVVLNNGFEPFNPSPGLDMLAGSRQVVVIRDPRDCYVSGLNHYKVDSEDKHLLAFDNDGLSKSFLATDDLDMFVRRYRLYNEKVYQGDDPRTLHIRFEDLVRRYEDCVARIFRFLEISPLRHKQPGKYFDHHVSAKNVGIWRHYRHRDEVRYLESELSEFLIDV
ncbi:MAG: hypothetical protein M2R45_01807 [Verrucomicrobia subdivision 3 bacterium]|nr:hypothetical protein [Limisphaerales bacterium]MCS1415838.1 hypothetical protein [Limisphaerales bacterium]